MQRFKFSDLLGYEEKIKQAFSFYGVNYHDLNRIHQYFVYLNEIEAARNTSKVTFHDLIEKNKVKYYFSLFYTLEFKNIIEAILKSNQDKDLVKTKLSDLIKGTYLLSEETLENTKSRNTAFELGLFHYFQRKNLQSRLGNPNPDIMLTTNNFIYNIECKRPFLFESLEKNIKKALKQLRKIHNKNAIPTIALSLERIILGNDLILDTNDEKSALSFLDKTLYKFLQNNLPMIQKICGDEPCLILYCLSCLVGFKTDIPMASATFITGNLYNFKEDLSKRIYEDLQILKP
ncbi:hypothetical protein C4559_00880 [Candidatus Microgenomates bacterium]|nr:MAG: hypothetical protein C4559_00880 [Candidatus Microgenomates bacterium]